MVRGVNDDGDDGVFWGTVGEAVKIRRSWFHGLLGGLQLMSLAGM